MSDRYSYSLQHLFYGHSPTRGLIDLVIASFLHWDIFHLLGNVSLILIFMTFLECVMGSGYVVFIFLAGILFANPLTSVLFSPYYFVSRDGFMRFFAEPDIGCSLGIFACIGALSLFVKRPVILILIMTLATLVYNVHEHSILGYNHLIALAIGFGLGKKYVASS